MFWYQSYSIRFVLSDTPLANTIYGAAAGNEQNMSMSIQNIPDGNVLTLRNNTGVNTANLQTTSCGTQPSVNASIVILKIN